MNYYLKYRYRNFLFIFPVFCFLVMGWEVFLAVTFISALLRFLYRELSLSPLVETSANESIFLAPISGTVWRVRENVKHEFFGEKLKEIVLIKPFFSEMGLRLPLHSELMRFAYEKPPFIFRLLMPKNFCDDQSHRNLGGACQLFRSYTGNEYGVQIISTFLSGRPRVFLEPGDKGKQGGVFGYLPFGGIVNLYVSDDVEVLAKAGDSLVACETPLCGSPKAMG